MTPTDKPDRTILFTAFEPSGDAHASSVIAELRKRHPDMTLYAWGGPQMRAAGATIVEETGHNAAMGAGGLAKIREHWQINKRLRKWLQDNPVALHVPVDSPAANFPICKITRGAGCRILHLVAPQLWAWAPWRIRKLRRLTDGVLCLLPFEETYFKERQVPARFIGHPVMSETLDVNELASGAAALPEGQPRIAFLPGSRPSEVTHNLPSIARIFDQMRATCADAIGCIAAANDDLSALMQRVVPTLPDSLHIETNRLNEVLQWADIAIVCSGTATLNVARHGVPMVVMYRMSPLPWMLIGRWLVTTPFLALPNLIMNRRIAPEFIPHFGSEAPIVESALQLLQPESAAAQREDLAALRKQFDDHDPAALAADEIERVLGIH